MNVNTRSIVATLAFAVAFSAAFAQQPSAPPQGGPGAGAPPPATAGATGKMHHAPRHRDHGFDGQLDESVGLSERPWWRNPMVAEQIGLTPDQVKRLDDISLQGELKLVRLRADVESGELVLRATLDAPTIDARSADQQIDKVAEARAAVEKAEAHLAIDLRGVLTPEQWTRMHQHGPMGGPRGSMQGGHRGPKAPPAAPATN